MQHRGFIAGILGVATVLATGAALAQGPRHQMTFETFDRDGDGAITRAEIEGHQAARFAQADENDDGMLSREELVAAAARRAEDRVTAMLERFDADADGALSLDEMPKRGGKRAGRMFDRVDANDDGSLSRAEFDAAKARMAERRKRHSGQN